MKACLALLLCSALWAQVPEEEKLPQEKELDVVDFKNVKSVLQKDGLSQEAARKQSEVKRIKVLRKQDDVNRHLWPSTEDFWPLAVELWLVKSAPTLKWDFDRPDYGLEASLDKILRDTGRIGKKFRVLALDSVTPAHLALPWRKDEYCLLFSVPFARAMDLSKLEIAVLLLQDVLRADEGWLQQQVTPAKLKDLAGTSFPGQRPDLTPVYEVGSNLTTFINEKGFSFQQQFQITKQMDALLKPHPELWNAYVRLLGKIDRLVKGNLVHGNYIKLYPSPEMQIRWLAPEEKVL
jgi:hypothetical protein